MEQFDSRYFRGQGKIFIGPRDSAGKPAGLVFVGNVTSAVITGNIERASKVESVTGKGGIGSSFIKSSKYAVSLALSSIKAAHLKEALHGIVTVKTGASVTDESHLAYDDAFILLIHTKVSAVIVTDNTNTTTYAAGADYVLDADAGTIEILSTGAIVNAQEVYADYTYAAQTHTSASPNNDEKYIFFDGINSADNDKRVRSEMYKTKISPGALALITDETTDIQLDGEIELDSVRPVGDQFFSWKTED